MARANNHRGAGGVGFEYGLLSLSDRTDGAEKIEYEKTAKGGWKGGGCR